MRKSLFSIGYIFLLGLCFASLVSAVKLGVQDRIDQNRVFKLQKVILSVLGLTSAEASDQDAARVFDRQVRRIEVGDKFIYIGRDQTGRIVGYAFPVGGPGFWGPIDGMIAVDPGADRIIGLSFYKHSETPGLGGRISEDWFQEQFKGLPLRPVSGDRKIFYLRPPGSGNAERKLDAITGATNTSAAVETFLNRDLNNFLTELWADVKEVN